MSEKAQTSMTVVEAYGSNDRPKPSRKFNWSTYFLLPIVINISYRYKNLINSYIYNIEDIDKNNNYIYVLIKELDINLTKHKRYIEHNKIDRGYLYTFDIKDYKNDIDLFIQGKYSKFSQELKDLLCYNQPVVPIMSSVIYKILYRTEDKRIEVEKMIGMKLHEDAEVASSPYVEDEMYEE